MFSPSNELFISVTTDCSLVKMTSYCLNHSLVLNLCAAVVLQSIITLVANSLHIKIMLDCFLVHLVAHIYVFYDPKDILL